MRKINVEQTLKFLDDEIQRDEQFNNGDKSIISVKIEELRKFIESKYEERCGNFIKNDIF